MVIQKQLYTAIDTWLPTSWAPSGTPRNADQRGVQHSPHISNKTSNPASGRVARWWCLSPDDAGLARRRAPPCPAPLLLAILYLVLSSFFFGGNTGGLVVVFLRGAAAREGRTEGRDGGTVLCYLASMQQRASRAAPAAFFIRETVILCRAGCFLCSSSVRVCIYMCVCVL